MSDHIQSVHDLARILKVIADETRLRILGALAEQSLTGKDLAARLDLTPATISHHMRKLVDAGIVRAQTDAQRQWYTLNEELLRMSRRVQIDPAGEAAGTTPEGSDDRFRAKVIRDFFEGERLKQIPAQRKRRVIILQHLLQRFDPARSYTEREVNDLLRPAHEDVATLRRELVDYGFFQRDRGIYQVTRAAPERSRQLTQEFVGDESIWLQSLLARATTLEV